MSLNPPRLVLPLSLLSPPFHSPHILFHTSFLHSWLSARQPRPRVASVGLHCAVAGMAKRATVHARRRTSRCDATGCGAVGVRRSQRAMRWCCSLSRQGDGDHCDSAHCCSPVRSPDRSSLGACSSLILSACSGLSRSQQQTDDTRAHPTHTSAHCPARCSTHAPHRPLRCAALAGHCDLPLQSPESPCSKSSRSVLPHSKGTQRGIASSVSELELL